tara:strand:- start:216 stop:347 length:132 start_codon:yes stop_codon:yes gene_type:complete
MWYNEVPFFLASSHTTKGGKIKKVKISKKQNASTTFTIANTNQ